MNSVPNKLANHPRKQGFTLIEMLLVLAVLGILLTISGLFLSRLLQQQRLTEAATTLSESLRQAANRALTQSSRIFVEVSANKVTWLAEDGTTILREEGIPNGAVVSPAKSFTLTGRGFPEVSETFTTTLAAKSRTVTMLPTGVVVIR